MISLFISHVNTSLWHHQFVSMPSKLVSEIFFWLMGKCMFPPILDKKKFSYWRSYRLCEFFPCYVRTPFSFKWVLTSIIFRLNSRDDLRRERSSDNHSLSLHIMSAQQDRTSRMSKTWSAPVSVTVHKTTTTDLAKSEHSSELDKSVGVSHTVVALRDWDRRVFWRDEW
jgi:hypothetical protein